MCRLSLSKKFATPVELEAKDTLKLTFQIVDEAGNGVQPHQTFLRFFDPQDARRGYPARARHAWWQG